MENKAYMGR